MRSALFWDFTQRRMLFWYRRFGIKINIGSIFKGQIDLWSWNRGVHIQFHAILRSLSPSIPATWFFHIPLYSNAFRIISTVTLMIWRFSFFLTYSSDGPFRKTFLKISQKFKPEFLHGINTK